jgi:hypothetical protein
MDGKIYSYGIPVLRRHGGNVFPEPMRGPIQFLPSDQLGITWTPLRTIDARGGNGRESAVLESGQAASPCNALVLPNGFALESK